MATTKQKTRHFKDRCQEVLQRASLKYENNIKENHDAIADGTVPMMSELAIRQYFSTADHIVIHMDKLFDFSAVEIAQVNRYKRIRPIIQRLQAEKDRAVDRIMLNSNANAAEELRTFEDLVTKRLTNLEPEEA